MTTTQSIDWHARADEVLNGTSLTRDEARAILNVPDEDTLNLVHAAWKLRRHYFGHKVKLQVLENAKSGACPEDCAFCSQSARFQTQIDTYPMESVDQMLEGARKAKETGAFRYCIVTATRGPSSGDLETICETVSRIKSEYGLEICTSLGLLDEDAARRLKEAGVDRFNHNLETGPENFGNVCTTHTFADRVKTVQLASAAGMEICSGGIVGMGETEGDRIELAFTLRDLDADSIPVNFLDPRPGTPLGLSPRLTPLECLRILCMFRFVNPDKEIRVAGGREVNLRHLQAMALYVADSMFTNGYLTTDGQHESEDVRMLTDAGFEIETE